MDSTEKKLIEKFLSTQVNNINNNNWEEFYNDLYQFDDEQYELESYLTPIITEKLYKVGINPLLYMKIVPKNFLHSSNIKSFTIPDNIETIDEYAFYYCDYLTSIKLPNNLGSIKESAFENCKSLNKITFPKKLKYVGVSAFENSGIKSVVYEGTKEEFKTITFNKNNNKLYYNTIIECSDGKLTTRYRGYSDFFDWVEVE